MPGPHAAAAAATLTSLPKDDYREYVKKQYDCAEFENRRAFKDPKNPRHEMATSDYVYGNQKEDAAEILELFKDNQGGEGMGNPCRVVSVKKHVKLGADGVILDLIRQICTDSDDHFIVSPDNVRVITGMSNREWQDELCAKAPGFLKDKIFHHGQLGRADLKSLVNGIIVIDEIDTGIGEQQILHQHLRNAGLTDFNNLKKQNIRIVVISATLAKQLCELTCWGQAHQQITMRVPDSYAGIEYFQNKGIIQESYDMGVEENVERWLEDDVKSYNEDFRVHLLRLPRKKKNQPEPRELIERLCIKHKIGFKMFSGSDPHRKEEWKGVFDSKVPLTRHYVLALKCGGLLRRATRIAESHKLRIGAVHQSPSKNPDYNAISQDLIGRMCGHWKNKIESGHRVGPFRVALEAVDGYIKEHNDELTEYKTNSYSTDKEGNVIKYKPSALNPKNITNLDGEDVTEVKITHNQKESLITQDSYIIMDTFEQIKKAANFLKWDKRSVRKPGENKNGFIETSINNSKSVISLKEAIQAVPNGYGTNKGKITWRAFYPCYEDKTDKNTLKFVLIIRPKFEQPKRTNEELQTLKRQIKKECGLLQ